MTSNYVKEIFSRYLELFLNNKCRHLNGSIIIEFVHFYYIWF